MEKELVEFSDIFHELFKNPSESSVKAFSEYLTEELNSGHLAQLSQGFKNIGDVDDVENSTIEELFNLDFHLIIPFKFIFEALVDHDVICTPDAVDALRSLMNFLKTVCEKCPSGKKKLASVVPVLIHTIVLAEEVFPLRIEALNLTNTIVGHADVGLNVDSVAYKKIEDNMEHLLVTAGDYEIQAEMIELIYRLIPHNTIQKKAQQYFSIDSVSQALKDITSEEFEAGCRNFINTLNQSQKEKQSVASFPCLSAYFGRTRVYQPCDKKIPDFWVDFNLGSKSIFLYVEEKDKEGNYKEVSTWESVVIKAACVKDYRLKVVNSNDVALLLKLNCPASELVSFASDETSSHYVKFSFNAKYASQLASITEKIFGSPDIQSLQNTSGNDSDVSSTPSTKASVAIYPVRIKSSTTQKACVMPTPSVMSKVSKNISDKLDKIKQNVDEFQDEIAVKDPPKEVEVTHSKEPDKEETNKEETNTNPVKRSSKRLQTKTQLKEDQRKYDSEKEHDMSKSDSSEKSLPTAFNVSKRLASSKGKSVPKPLSDAAKGRKAIRERVFSNKGHSVSLLEGKQKPKENYSKFHMLTPERTRDPRSGKRRFRSRNFKIRNGQEGKVQKSKPKEDTGESVDEAVDIVQDSLPIADSMEDASGPNNEEKSNNNQEFSPKKKKVGKKVVKKNTGSVLETTSKNNSKARQKTEVQVTKTAGVKKDAARRKSRASTQQRAMSPLYDHDDDISTDKLDGFPKRKNMSVLEGVKKDAASRKSRASTQQRTMSPQHYENELDISTDKPGGILRRKNIPVLEGVQKDAASRKSRASTQQRTMSPQHDDDDDISTDKPGGILRRKNMSVLEGVKKDAASRKSRASTQQHAMSPQHDDDGEITTDKSGGISRRKNMLEGAKKDAANRKSFATQQRAMSPQHDDDESGGIPRRKNASVLEGNKGGASKRTVQNKSAKQQLTGAPGHKRSYEDIDDDGIESYDIPDNQDDPDLEGNKGGASKRTGQNKSAKQQLTSAPGHKRSYENIDDDDDIPDNQDDPDLEGNKRGASKENLQNKNKKQPLADCHFDRFEERFACDDISHLQIDDMPEMDHIPDNQGDPELEGDEGSGYGTEYYAQEPSPVYETSTPAVRRPVSRELSPIEDRTSNSVMDRRSRQLSRTPKSGVESDDLSEEENIPLRLWLSESNSAASRNNIQHSKESAGSEQENEKEESEREFESVGSDESDNEIQHGSKKRRSRVMNPVSRNDSGIGETPFAEDLKKQTRTRKRSRAQIPLQVSITPITPRSAQLMEPDEDSPEDVEEKRQKRKRRFVDWSRSGPTGPTVSGKRNPEQAENRFKEPAHASRRDQRSGKPRRLPFKETSTPYSNVDNDQEPDEGTSDEDEIRREVQGLVNLAGNTIIQAVRRKRRTIRSFFQKGSDIMSTTIDSFWDETQKTSYSALEKHRNQFREQVQILGKQMDKTSSIVEGMEETFAKQFRILKGHQKADEKRFQSLQHTQGLMETELRKLERKRDEQEATLRTEMEKEMLKLQNKFLKDTRKQKEDELKMMLNTLWIP